MPSSSAPLRKRRDCLRLALGSAVLTAVAAGGDARADADRLHWRERVLLGFGTTLWLRAAHQDTGRLDRALDAAVRELREIEASLSLFDPDSAVSRLNRHGVLHWPDAHLRRVLRAALDMASNSDGAFDPTVQPLWSCWAQAVADGAPPSPRALARARSCVGWQHLRADDQAIEFARPGMAITLNGIAQGYAADRVATVLSGHGIGHALIDAGEWVSQGAAPDGGDWRFGVEDPFSPPRLLGALRIAPGACVAASSFTHQKFSADGRQHHILDPRTGRSPPAVAAVAVVAASAMHADALTKVMFMAGPSRALDIAPRWRAQVMVVDRAGRRTMSEGLRLVG